VHAKSLEERFGERMTEWQGQEYMMDPSLDPRPELRKMDQQCAISPLYFIRNYPYSTNRAP
jgi:hypothetical protein